MVATRSSTSRVERDENRMIVVVTGANSGFGLGLCQQLLYNLSFPPGSDIPAAKPQSTALPPSLQYLLHQPPSATTPHIPSPPPALTLILACRSETKAIEAKEILLKRHLRDLENRKKRGEKVREGWRDGLRVVWEGVDLDSPGGQNGVLAFCERLKERYPHITTLCLNAGMGAWSGLNYWTFFKQMVQDGMPLAMSQPKYQYETKGAMSRDGERGLVWGTNVLAPYIMARELAPLLRNSPTTLPFSPRIIYTSSLTSFRDKLTKDPLDDYQLIEYENSYSASKYMGDVVMCELDREYNADIDRSYVTQGEKRTLRVLTTDPGCVTTNFFSAGLGAGAWAWWADVKWVFYWLAFYICRIIGSPWHPVYADQGALPLIYASLIPDEYIPPASQIPAPRFSAIAERWGRTKVGYGEVDRWEEGLDIGKGVVERCEVIRKEWRRKEGLE
ncbi:3-keto sterol reductase [Kwoniella heveanensis BCC8398]|uniref:3-keto sterol reductase n=1 Tax=Kwoniella heveanensis BCC8398 TaxID=1296120 RepID=A0A1B9GLH2_9TREE|nr:3-keto sterol reductase [Kwoniella heveanensis BCC8398]